MRIKIHYSILDSKTQQVSESDASRVTVFADGQEFIITVDAGGLVIKSNREINIAPNSPKMVHLNVRTPGE